MLSFFEILIVVYLPPAWLILQRKRSNAGYGEGKLSLCNAADGNVHIGVGVDALLYALQIIPGMNKHLCLTFQDFIDHQSY